MILSFETATNICSVSLKTPEGGIYEKRVEKKGSHSELLFQYVKELREEHHFKLEDLHAVLVSTGPGSYTGLRIAASAVKGMLFDTQVEVFAGNTLAGFAECLPDGITHAVINARRKHLYHQMFEKKEGLKPLTASRILELGQVEELLNPGDQIIGTGVDRLSTDKCKGLEMADSSQISSKGLIQLFESNDREKYFAKTTAEQLESNYLNTGQVNDSAI